MNSNYIAYFDILGYKDAVLNSGDQFIRRVEHILRDIEHALALDHSKYAPGGRIIADEAFWVTNVHFISDTIIFWPRSDSEEDIENFLRVSLSFNNKMNAANMPVRGCLYFGRFTSMNWSHNSVGGGKYATATIAGKALIEAHNKAENQSWAGTVIDKTVIDELSTYPVLLNVVRENCTLEIVPYKKAPLSQDEEYVMRLFPGVHQTDNMGYFVDSIRRIFEVDNRNFASPRAQVIFENTIDCLKRQIKH